MIYKSKIEAPQQEQKTVETESEEGNRVLEEMTNNEPVKHYKSEYEKQGKVSLDKETLLKHTMSFIADFEWFEECAYADSWKYSIWYGTDSYKGECITKEEAKQRKIEHINPIYALVDKSCFTDNQKISLISYQYNVWKYPMNLQTHIKNCDKQAIVNVMKNWGWSSQGVRLWGLVKRRTIEIEKFNT